MRLGYIHRLFHTVFLAGVLASCHKGKDKFPSTELGGHACSGLYSSMSLYHDNSLEAFQYALSFKELSCIEVDVHISKDTTAWMFHDSSLEKETNGNGCISELSDSYLFGIHYTGLKNENLARVIDLPKDLKGKSLIIDLRESSECSNGLIDSTRLVTALMKIKNHFHNTPIAVVYNTSRLNALFSSWGWKSYLSSYNKLHFLNYPTNFSFNGACFSHEDCSKEDLIELKQLGYSVIVMGAKSPKQLRRALKKEPSILLVDDIKEAINEKYR